MAKISQGTTVHISNEDADATLFSAATFIKIGEVRDVPSGGGEAADIDVTHLESDAKEYLIGLPDEGTRTIAFNAEDGDTGQDELFVARDSQERRWLKITWASGPVWHAKALVKKVDWAGGVDKEISGSASFRISGSWTRA